jgi:excisionase family DNA binding protein
MAERVLHPCQEAANLLAISLRKLDQLIRDRAIRTLRIGRRRLVPHDQLLRFAKRTR